jgi:hypothetical protein
LTSIRDLLLNYATSREADGDEATGKERRISRWEHEAVLEAVQARLDRNPDKMRERRQTVEHPFGTIKSWMGPRTSR